MALKLAEEQALREEEEAKEEEANNPMKLLENRTKQSKNEIELLESLEELKDLNKRQQVIDYDTMLLAYDTTLTEKEREEKLQQMDEEYIKSIKFKTGEKRKLVVAEEIIEEGEQTTSTSTDSAAVTSIEVSQVPLVLKPTSSWSKPKVSTNVAKKNLLGGLVKVKKTVTKETTEENTVTDENSGKVPEAAKPSGGLSLVGDYSDSDSE